MEFVLRHNLQLVEGGQYLVEEIEELLLGGHACVPSTSCSKLTFVFYLLM
jgi:hypothetical protein